jgi:hypothetical protein
MGGEFESTTKPKGNETPLQAAANVIARACHFNWFQVVVQDPDPTTDKKGNALKVPYIDPPIGGSIQVGKGGKTEKSYWADDLPWYWNETPPPPGYKQKWPDDDTRKRDLQFNESDTELLYSDAPGNTGSKPIKLGFMTWLVAVDVKGKLVKWLNGFEWAWSDNDGRGGKGVGRVTSLKELQGPPSPELLKKVGFPGSS